MINIEKNGVETFRTFLWCQGPFKKITMQKAAARIGNQTRTERNKTLLVPFDDRFEIVNHDERSDAVVFQRGACRVTEAETADDHVKSRFSRMSDRGRGEPECGKGLLNHRKETRHEVGIPEEDFVDLTIPEREERALSQDQVPERGLPEVDFFKEG